MDPALTDDQDDAEMLAGFNSDEGGQPDDEGNKPTDPPGSQAQQDGAAPKPAGQQVEGAAATADQSSSAEPQDDPFAALPEAVRNLLAKVPTLEASLAAEEQNRRRLEGQVRSQQSQLAKLTASPSPAPAQPAERRLDKLEQARSSVGTDMPEVMDALDEIASLIPQAPAPQPQAQAPASAPVQESVVEPQADPVANAHFETLDTLRPGWFQTLDSTDAKLWLSANPAMAAKFNTADTAVKLMEVLDGFTASRQQLKTAQSEAQARQARMAAAVVPNGGARQPTRTPPGSEEDGMVAGFSS